MWVLEHAHPKVVFRDNVRGLALVGEEVHQHAGDRCRYHYIPALDEADVSFFGETLFATFGRVVVFVVVGVLGRSLLVGGGGGAMRMFDAHAKHHFSGIGYQRIA